MSELRQLVERAKERKKKLRTSSEDQIVEGAEVCVHYVVCFGTIYLYYDSVL